jgi:hypothetical protein
MDEMLAKVEVLQVQLEAQQVQMEAEVEHAREERRQLLQCLQAMQQRPQQLQEGELLFVTCIPWDASACDHADTHALSSLTL